MKISTAKKHVTLANKAFKADPSKENQNKLEAAERVVLDMQAADAPATEQLSPEQLSHDAVIEANLENGKDTIIISLVQEFGVSLAKAAVIYRTYATAHDLDDKKNSMSHQLIEWFTSNPVVSNEEIQKKGEEIGLSKSSVNYYKTMLTLARDVATKL